MSLVFHVICDLFMFDNMSTMELKNISLGGMAYHFLAS